MDAHTAQAGCPSPPSSLPIDPIEKPRVLVCCVNGEPTCAVGFSTFPGLFPDRRQFTHRSHSDSPHGIRLQLNERGLERKNVEGNKQKKSRAMMLSEHELRDSAAEMERACSWQGLECDMPAHLDVCEFGIIRCGHGLDGLSCGNFMMRKFHPRHQIQDCAMRVSENTSASQIFKFDVLTTDEMLTDGAFSECKSFTPDVAGFFHVARCPQPGEMFTAGHDFLSRMVIFNLLGCTAQVRLEVSLLDTFGDVVRVISKDPHSLVDVPGYDVARGPNFILTLSGDDRTRAVTSKLEGFVYTLSAQVELVNVSRC
jgi:hypothetical protein